MCRVSFHILSNQTCQLWRKVRESRASGVEPAKRSRFLVLTKRSLAAKDENAPSKSGNCSENPVSGERRRECGERLYESSLLIAGVAFPYLEFFRILAARKLERSARAKQYPHWSTLIPLFFFFFFFLLFLLLLLPPPLEKNPIIFWALLQEKN